MKICRYCGTQNEDRSNFCTGCGAALEESAGRRNGQPEEEIIYTDVAPRSIVLAIIFTIITFGFYGIYWMYKLNNEINELARDPDAPGGGLVIILWIVTLGIYGFYWYYKMGEKCDYIRQTNNNSGLIYLILAIIGLGIVSNALMQETINKVLE